MGTAVAAEKKVTIILVVGATHRMKEKENPGKTYGGNSKINWTGKH